MRIAIITYQGYDGAGVLHAHEFANQMVDLGHEVLLLLCGSLETSSVLAEEPRYLVREVTFDRGALEISLVGLVEGFEAEIIHLWTPRHLPARVGLEMWGRGSARLLIHYEDDEEYILSEVSSNSQFGEDDLQLYRFLREETFTAAALERHAASLRLDFLRETVLEPYCWSWIHPLVTPVVEKLASGFTSISAAYGRLLGERTNVPIRTLYPGVDHHRFSMQDNSSSSLRRDLGLTGRTVFLYSGSIAAFHDFPSFIRALPAVVRDYPEIILVQIGHNYIPEITGPLLEELGIASHVVFAGPVAHAVMPQYLSLADVFLGVTAPNRFNAHRLPSKIPEYMALGKPIILADVGVAGELEDVTEVIKVDGDTREELERGFRRAMELRLSWPAMGQRLRERAKRIFDWRLNTEHLLSFYEEILASEENLVPEGVDADVVASRPPVPSPDSGGEVRRIEIETGRRRVLVATEGRIGRQMSGIGIRYLEISRSLGVEFDVILAHSGARDEVSVRGVRQIHWSPSEAQELLKEAATADAIIVHSYLLQKNPELASCRGLLIVDLYCPFIFENIEIHRDRGMSLGEREGIHDNDLSVFNEQLLMGDYFLAATERQRDWLLGALTSLGRLRPATCPPEAEPESYVGLVPLSFGVESPAIRPRRKKTSAMRGVWPGIEDNDIILLWGGGIWSWLDPLTPVRAMKRIAQMRSDIKLVFLSTRTVENVIEMPVLGELFGLVDKSDELQKVVFFNTKGFIGYEDRELFFTEADIGICAHRQSLESHFSYRTRVFDYIRFGLPTLTSAGDYCGELVSQEGLGFALPIGDVDAWTSAILKLADDQARAECRRRVLRKGQNFLGSRTTETLACVIKGGGVSGESP